MKRERSLHVERGGTRDVVVVHLHQLVELESSGGAELRNVWPAEISIFLSVALSHSQMPSPAELLDDARLEAARLLEAVDELRLGVVRERVRKASGEAADPDGRVLGAHR